MYRKKNNVCASVCGGKHEHTCTHACSHVSFLVVVVYSLSHVWLFATPWTVACQAPLSMEFPRQEYWSGLPFPFPGHLPDQGSNLRLQLGRQILHYRATWEAPLSLYVHNYFGEATQGNARVAAPWEGCWWMSGRRCYRYTTCIIIFVSLTLEPCIFVQGINNVC